MVASLRVVSVIDSFCEAGRHGLSYLSAARNATKLLLAPTR